MSHCKSEIGKSFVFVRHFASKASDEIDYKCRVELRGQIVEFERLLFLAFSSANSFVGLQNIDTVCARDCGLREVGNACKQTHTECARDPDLY